MKAFLILVVIAFGLRTCPSKRSDESSPYKAIRCGLNRKDELKETFIFHKGNGHLFYFDLDKDNFYPINRRVKKEPYFNSMEEISSRLERNKFQGNKLIVTYIDYIDKDLANTLIAKKIINLRWLLMYSSTKTKEGERNRRIYRCKWVKTQEVNSYY